VHDPETTPIKSAYKGYAANGEESFADAIEQAKQTLHERNVYSWGYHILLGVFFGLVAGGSMCGGAVPLNIAYELTQATTEIPAAAQQTFINSFSTGKNLSTVIALGSGFFVVFTMLMKHKKQKSRVNDFWTAKTMAWIVLCMVADLIGVYVGYLVAGALFGRDNLYLAIPRPNFLVYDPKVSSTAAALSILELVVGVVAILLLNMSMHDTKSASWLGFFELHPRVLSLRACVVYASAALMLVYATGAMLTFENFVGSHLASLTLKHNNHVDFYGTPMMLSKNLLAGFLVVLFVVSSLSKAAQHYVFT
jgi:hypothetical protein